MFLINKYRETNSSIINIFPHWRCSHWKKKLQNILKSFKTTLSSISWNHTPAAQCFKRIFCLLNSRSAKIIHHLNSVLKRRGGSADPDQSRAGLHLPGCAPPRRKAQFHATNLSACSAGAHRRRPAAAAGVRWAVRAAGAAAANWGGEGKTRTRKSESTDGHHIYPARYSSTTSSVLARNYAHSLHPLHGAPGAGLRFGRSGDVSGHAFVESCPTALRTGGGPETYWNMELNASKSTLRAFSFITPSSHNTGEEENKVSLPDPRLHLCDFIRSQLIIKRDNKNTGSPKKAPQVQSVSTEGVYVAESCSETKREEPSCHDRWRRRAARASSFLICTSFISATFLLRSCTSQQHLSKGGPQWAVTILSASTAWLTLSWRGQEWAVGPCDPLCLHSLVSFYWVKWTMCAWKTLNVLKTDGAFLHDGKNWFSVCDLMASHYQHTN